MLEVETEWMLWAVDERFQLVWIASQSVGAHGAAEVAPAKRDRLDSLNPGLMLHQQKGWYFGSEVVVPPEDKAAAEYEERRNKPKDVLGDSRLLTGPSTGYS